MSINPEYLQLGAVAIIFLFAIKEFFSYLKSRKTTGTSNNYEVELAKINEKLNNHIEHFCKSLDENCGDIKDIKKDINTLNIAVVRVEAKITSLTENK